MSATHDNFESDSFESEDFFRSGKLPARPARFDPPLYGGARLATEADIARQLNGVDEDFPTFGDVSCLLDAGDGKNLTAIYRRKLFLSGDTRRRGMLIVGPPGSGKTERFLFPLALSDLQDKNTSIVLTCTKGDLETKLRPFIEQYRPGTRIEVINFSDQTRTTAAWNPLANCANSGQALRAAEDFCNAASNEVLRQHDSPFWNQNAARLMAAAQLIEHKMHGRVCPADVHRMLELPLARLLELFEANKEVSFAAGCQGFLMSGSHNAETVLATAQGHLRRFCDERLAATTSTNEFHFEQLFVEPTVLIVEVTQADLDLVRPVLNAFFVGMFSAATSFAQDQPGRRLPRPLCVSFDDFVASLGKLSRFASFGNLMRSCDVRLTAAVQTLRQFSQAYEPGEDDAVMTAFGTKIFLSGVDPFDAHWASEQSGTITVERVELRQETGDGEGEVINTSRSVSPAARPLLLADEIRLSPDHFALGRASTVFLPDVPPFQAWFRPAYETPGIAERLKSIVGRPRIRQLRSAPLVYSPATGSAPVANPNESNRPGITNCRGLPAAELLARIELIRDRLGWKDTVGSAHKWWLAFESENRERPALVLRLLEELALRNATISEFFLAYVYSNTDNIQANLHYMDYVRLKREEERSRKAARFQTGDKCPPSLVGSYRFDGWIHEEDEEAYSGAHATTDHALKTATAVIRKGGKFPSHPVVDRPCYWARESSPSGR